jgi:hypothetical protein
MAELDENVLSLRSIWASIAMQVSLGGKPQRSDRSQSPQSKPFRRRCVLAAGTFNAPRTAFAASIARMLYLSSLSITQHVEIRRLPR